MLTDNGTWLKSLKAEVYAETFQKGRQYAENRRVSMLARTDVGIAAKVTGSKGEKYDVQVAPHDDGSLDSLCNCAVWNKLGRHCQHVVAASLVYLAKLRANAQSKDGDKGVTNGVTQLERWLGLSAQPNVELFYRLTLAPPGPAGRSWLLSVRDSDNQLKDSAQIKKAIASNTCVTPADERILFELSKYEMRFDAKVMLFDAALANILELLKQRRVIYRGTTLQFSEVSARLLIRLSNIANGIVARVSFGLSDGIVVDFKDVVTLIGRQTWILAGQIVYRLEPDFPARLLNQWLLNPAIEFPNDQIEDALSFFAAHLPRYRIGFQGEGFDVDETVQPQFVLTLDGDAHAVKAQLTARYGAGVAVPVSPTGKYLGYAASGKKLFLRQEATENRVGQQLVELGLKYNAPNNNYEATGDDAVDFWLRGRKELPKAWEVHSAAQPQLKMRGLLRAKVRVSLNQGNSFSLDSEFAAESQKVDMEIVRQFLTSGRKYILLPDGSFAETNINELKQVTNLLEEVGAFPGTKLPLFHATSIDLLSTLGDVEMEAKARRAITEIKEIDGIPSVKVPQDLQVKLRHYQEAGLSWLWFLYRHGLSGVLADDMGLGKTVQALSLLLKVKHEYQRQVNLVVAPTSVLPNWAREIECFAPSLSFIIWHGADRHERKVRLQNVDVILTSYALIRRDIEALKRYQYRTVILDEAQSIKNADSVTAQACKRIEALHRIALTGTPLENRLSELWSLFDFLMPGFLGTAEDFADRFDHPISAQGDSTVRDRLRKRIRPFVMRRLKTEVAEDLPPKTEIVTRIDMGPEQAALYREVLEESKRKVYQTINKVGFAQSKISILAALMKLRQVCCDPRLLKLPTDTPLPPSAKLERFGELIEELTREGHRALVFSQFTEMLELLKAHVDAVQMGYLYLDGRTRNRMEKVDAFNAPDGPPLFFISLKAGGTGLNLIAADYVIHFDPWWNPAVEDQATDRIHRIGQTRAVFSYKLITQGTVEEKILNLQQRKRDLIQGVLASNVDIGKALTEDDIENLFSFSTV